MEQLSGSVFHPDPQTLNSKPIETKSNRRLAHSSFPEQIAAMSCEIVPL
jgi:hypothetical protein